MLLGRNLSNEEKEKLKPWANTVVHPPSYDFDDDIVEYKEEKDSSDENINSKPIPMATNEDYIVKVIVCHDQPF